MHLLSSKNRSEFLAVPALCRVTMAQGKNGFVPTILIKASTLIIKFIALGTKISFVIKFRSQDQLIIYGVKIYDEPTSPTIIWSAVEVDDEKKAIEAIISERCSSIYLFNELAINVLGSQKIQFNSQQNNNSLNIDDSILGFKFNSEKQNEIQADFPMDEVEGKGYWDVELETVNKIEWYQPGNTYISNGLYNSEIQILNEDEGAQQEQLALWLCDELSLEGVAINPLVGEGGAQRELCDLFFEYEFGAFLIESKSISILNRVELPNKEKIQKNLAKHIKKAVNQLAGACRRLKRGEGIFFQGQERKIFDRNNVPHCIVLVSDLGELNEISALSIDIILEFTEKNSGMLHFLDLVDLLRLIQGAHMSQEKGEYTLLHYFDYLLIERWKRTIETKEAVIHMLIQSE